METLPQSDLMTFEAYAETKHPTPYTFELKQEQKELFYFGAKHSRDSSDPMFTEIEARFKETKPEIVLVEGRESINKHERWLTDKLKNANRNEIIKTGGEPELTLKLATEAGIEMVSPEPDFKSEVDYILAQGYSQDEIFAYYLYRMADQYQRLVDKPTIEDYLEPSLKEFKHLTNWENFDYSLDHLQTIGQKIWGPEGDLNKTKGNLTGPVRWPNKKKKWTRVNEVSQQSSLFRDQYVVEQIKVALKKYDRVFVVFGATHAVMEEPALRKIFAQENL